MPGEKFKSSSATEGFFQSLPVVPPQYTSQLDTDHMSSATTCDDPILTRLFTLYLPQPIPAPIDRHLHDLARECLSPEVLRWMVDAEVNPPTLHPLTTFGEVNRQDALQTARGWQQLKKTGIKNGTVALGYSTLDGQPAQWNRRLHQMAADHLWAGSAALVTCPAAMSDGAALLLKNHVNDGDGDQPGRSRVLNEARQRLISFDPSYAWTSGQWMTERSGGSDVSQTETIATRLDEDDLRDDVRQFGSQRDSTGLPLGPWKIDGFKWFSSATDADMVVMLAQTTQGLSAFYAPLRRARGSSSIMNGVRITRLKNKLGTKALPTSELEIRGMRGWLVGEEGKGVKEITAILNATRIWTATSAVAGLARGLAVARAYSRVRRVHGVLLQDNLQHVAWLAAETVQYRASTHLAFLGVALLGVVEQGEAAVRHTVATQFLPRAQAEAETLLRLLVPVMKSQCSLAAVSGLRACMESLGGVGYCENNEDGGILNLARIFRDTNVNPIWEGTTTVMAEDVVRVLKGKGGRQALASLDALISRLVQFTRLQFQQECSVILVAWSSLKRVIEDSDTPKLHYTGRDLLGGLEDVLCSLLLIVDAVVGNDSISAAVVSRWMSMRYGQPRPSWSSNWREQATLDRAIFLGYQDTAVPAKARL